MSSLWRQFDLNTSYIFRATSGVDRIFCFWRSAGRLPEKEPWIK